MKACEKKLQKLIGKTRNPATSNPVLQNLDIRVSGIRAQNQYPVQPYTEQSKTITIEQLSIKYP